MLVLRRKAFGIGNAVKLAVKVIVKNLLAEIEAVFIIIAEQLVNGGNGKVFLAGYKSAAARKIGGFFSAVIGKAAQVFGNFQNFRHMGAVI